VQVVGGVWGCVGGWVGDRGGGGVVCLNACIPVCGCHDEGLVP
jgi:hypothetical protein